jgi:ABC-type sugar transport system substrate-binding protein
VLLTPSTDWLPDKAAQFAQTLIPANPTIVAIGLASDGVQLPAVSQVLQHLNKWVRAGAPGHIYLDTIDGTPLALQDVRAGYVDSTVAQPYDAYAHAAIESLLGALAKKPAPTGSGVNGWPVRTLAGNPWTQPPPPVVTKATAGNPGLWGNQS